METAVSKKPVGKTTQTKPDAAAVVKTKGKKPVMKAVVKTKGKKPAVATKEKTGTVVEIGHPPMKWNKDDEGRSKNCYASLHIGRAQTLIRNKYPKMTAEDKRATLGFISMKARSLWEKHME